MLGADAMPSLAQYGQLAYVTRAVCESMRLYPHPPVLLRRALVADTLPGGYEVAPGQVGTGGEGGGDAGKGGGALWRGRKAGGGSGCCERGAHWGETGVLGCPRASSSSTSAPPSPPFSAQDVMISVYNIHHSEAVWEDPEAFRPERFPLDEPVPTELTTDFRCARG